MYNAFKDERQEHVNLPLLLHMALISSEVCQADKQGTLDDLYEVSRKHCFESNRPQIHMSHEFKHVQSARGFSYDVYFRLVRIHAELFVEGNSKYYPLLIHCCRECEIANSECVEK